MVFTGTNFIKDHRRRKCGVRNKRRKFPSGQERVSESSVTTYLTNK